MLQYISFSFPKIPNVRCAFQTRGQVIENDPYSSGNISLEVGDNPEHAIANRALITKSLNVESFSETKQVHGVKTIYEPKNTDYKLAPTEEADGLATTRKNHALCVKSADCQPILVCDITGEHIMALHAGWQGNRQNYPAIAVEEFCKHYNLNPASIFAVRGPSLSPAVSEFINYDTEWGADFNTWYNSKDKSVNLWELTISQLQSVGVPRSQIFGIDLCTFANPELFYSFRNIPKSGRQASFIWKI